jgi:hypothetical protein
MVASSEAVATVSEVGRRRQRLGPALPLLVLAAAALGTFMRLWYVFHVAVTSDESITALMAEQMLHGHFTAFYLGQPYGGSAEPAIEALFFLLFGSSAVTLHLVEVGLTAASAVVTWRIARRMVRDGWVALGCAALFWVSPKSAVADSVVSYGFRGATLLFGLAAFLLALRVVDGGRGLDFAGLGLTAGVAWWSSPESAYFLLPALAYLIWWLWSIRHDGAFRRALLPVATGALAFVVGALPWIWANVGSHLKSLRSSVFVVPPGTPGWLGRVAYFPKYYWPMLLNVRHQDMGTWLGGRDVGIVLYVTLAALVLVCLAFLISKPGPGRVVGGAALAFPFLMAASPATWYWQDGRYASYASPLIALVAGAGGEEAWSRLTRAKGPRRRHRPPRGGAASARPLFCLIAAGLGCTSAVVFFRDRGFRALATWSIPDRASEQQVRTLEEGGVRYGFADYWVAYRLDYLSNEKLHLTVMRDNALRSESLDRAVRQSPDPAWIFVQPDTQELIQYELSYAIRGPDGMAESRFLADLAARGIQYRIVRGGALQAVVPDAVVLPESVGLP